MRHRFDSMRGRPNKGRRSQADTQLLEYLAKVTVKYGVDSDKFLDSFLKAHQNRKSKCGKLSIECRLRGQDYAIFLVTRGGEVVGQFRMSEHIHNEKINPLKEFVCNLSIMRELKQERKSHSSKIKNLKAGMKHLDIKAQVLEVSQPMQIAKMSDSYANWANALIADETGTINLSLLGSQMKMVSVNDVVQIENAHVAWFRGERQLRVGRQGKISVLGPTADNTKMAHSYQKKPQDIVQKSE